MRMRALDKSLAPCVGRSLRPCGGHGGSIMSGVAHTHGHSRQPNAAMRSDVAASPRAGPASRSLGPSNQAIQAKLRIGAVDDPLEREADRVAEAVVAAAPIPSLTDAPPAPQRNCAECESEEV